MGAKTRMLVLADVNARKTLAAKPPLDRDASLKLASTLLPGERNAPALPGGNSGDEAKPVIAPNRSQ